MVNINARINWKPGMELTAQTFLDMDANLDFRQQVAIRAALGDRCMGLLPETTFDCSGSFYVNKFEIERFRCTALLPSGKIIQVDEPVSISVPMLYGNVYYLTVGFGTGQSTFEKEGVPYIRPQYAYAIHSIEEVMSNDVLPITRFVVNNGTFAEDNDFVPPCLMLSSHPVFNELKQHYADLLLKLAEHKNLKEGDGKRAMQRYLFMMKAFNMEGRVADFVSLTQEIAQAVDYFIMRPNTEQQVEIPQPVQGDIMKWLRWLEEYLTGTVAMLDGVVLEDDTIDYETLLAQAKKELYEQLNPELYAKLLETIEEELRDELTKSLRNELTSYMEDTVKPELGRILSNELHEKLYEKLYTELFEHLFNALYVPEPEEKEFIPMI
jgi:hypothetical protein